MAQEKARNLPGLFNAWMEGDAQAGEEMARRFSDWYYALSVSRLGERQGRQPLERACEAFTSEVSSVKSAARLVDWAHGLIRRELEAAGSRIPGGDFPNSLTRNRSPKELLAASWDRLPRGQLRLLAHAYDDDYPASKLMEEAEAAGGYPAAIMDARMALKRWLKKEQGVSFGVLPEEPDPDWAPLPVYEAGRMVSGREEARLERWVLSRYDLCHDLAEFSVFALALRDGALADEPAAEPKVPQLEQEGAKAVKQGKRTLWGLALLVMLGLLAGLAFLVSQYM